MATPSRLFAALVTVSLIGAACATKEGATGASSSVEEVPTEGTAAETKPTLEFTKMTVPEGFSVMAPPGDPQVQRGKVAIRDGEVQTASWTYSVEGVLYSISVVDYPEKVVASNQPAAFLNEGKTGIVNQLKGTLKSEEDVTLQGYPGKAFTVSSDNGEVKARNFLVGPRLYTLLALYNPSIGAPKADEFLTSLELIDPPPAIQPRSAATADGGTAADGGMTGTPPADGGMTGTTPADGGMTGTPPADGGMTGTTPGATDAGTPDAGTAAPRK